MRLAAERRSKMGHLTKEDRIEPVPHRGRLAWTAALLLHRLAIGCAATAPPAMVPHSRLLDHADLPGAGSAVVAALPGGRRLAGTGEVAYAAGLDAAQAATHRDWDAFAAPQPVRAARDGSVRGYQARYLGTLRRVDDAGPADGALATLRIVRAVREIVPGATLLPHGTVGAGGDAMAAAPPYPPPSTMRARVAAMLADGDMAGSGQVVVLDAGSADGLGRGQSVVICRSDGWRATRMPPDRIASASVVATASHIAYALVTAAIDAVRVGDHAVAPAAAPATGR